MKRYYGIFFKASVACVCLMSMIASHSYASGESKDSTIKSWTTAELLGAMRWAKAEATTTKAKLDFSAAEMICYKRLQKQIDTGSISKSAAFLIAEDVRRGGVYKREQLTLDRAGEIRQRIINGRIFEKLKE